MNDNMLVSVVVVTYNSASTVLETLESIKQQTYDRIELIVSDDCSKDDTVAVCQKWFKENEQRFVHSKLITIEKNTGVCANLNRAIAATKGEWVKEIAGDDILLPNCIEDFVTYVSLHPEVKWLSSYMQVFRNDFRKENCIERHSVSKRLFFDLPVNNQLKLIAKWNLIQAAPNFYEVALIREVGGYDLSYSFEDYPMFLTLLEHGYKCYFLDKETVGYRVHESAFNSSGKLFKYSFVLESKRFHKERCFKYLTWWQKIGQYSIWGLQYSLERLNLNRDTWFLRLFYMKTHSLLRKLFNN